jgi:hypothetical protein
MKIGDSVVFSSPYRAISEETVWLRETFDNLWMARSSSLRTPFSALARRSKRRMRGGRAMTGDLGDSTRGVKNEMSNVQMWTRRHFHQAYTVRFTFPDGVEASNDFEESNALLQIIDQTVAKT